MLFNSYVFLVFLGITFLLFYLPWLSRWQTQTLVLASFVFYAWNLPWLLGLLVCSIGVNSHLSHRLGHRLDVPPLPVLVAGLVFNVGAIALFKYGPLAGELLTGFRGPMLDALLTLPLPIGISFYTFESISLLVDLYRRRVRGEPTFVPAKGPRLVWDTALFVAFFPHLVSGPILKADAFFPQIGRRYFSRIDWARSFKLCVLGFFLKTVVADNLKDFTSLLAAPQFPAFSTAGMVALLFGYSAQIFADFAGYSQIAIGVGLLFGYQLPVNFNFPYIAASLGEFWRRWHISLSTWLREYLYFPLGGNRLGPVRTYVNLFIVMAIGGLWHGAAWSFAVWGIYHGLGLAVERWIADRPWASRVVLPTFVRMALVFLFVSFGWVLFKFPNFSDVMEFVRYAYRNRSVSMRENITIIGAVLIFSFPVALYHAQYLVPGLRRLLTRNEPLLYGSLLAMVVLAHGIPGTFIYFQF